MAVPNCWGVQTFWFLGGESLTGRSLSIYSWEKGHKFSSAEPEPLQKDEEYVDYTVDGVTYRGSIKVIIDKDLKYVFV